jgi:hypothetical protein
LIGHKTVSTLEPDGKLRAKRQLAAPQNPTLGPDWLVLLDDQRFMLLDRQTLATLADLPGQLGILSHGKLASGVLLYEWSPAGKVGRAITLMPDARAQPSADSPPPPMR